MSMSLICLLICLSPDNQRTPPWAVCSTPLTLGVGTRWAEWRALVAWPPPYQRGPTQTTWRGSLTRRWHSIRRHLAPFWSKMTFTSLDSIQQPRPSSQILGSWAARTTTSDRCQSPPSTEWQSHIRANCTAHWVRRQQTRWPLTSSNIREPVQTQTRSYSNKRSEFMGF